MVVHSNKLGEDEFGIGVMFSSIYGTDEKNIDMLILRNFAYHLYYNE